MTLGQYIVYIAKNFLSINGLRNKLYVLIKGPSWYIGKPRLGNLEDVPEVTKSCDNHVIIKC